MQTLEKLQVLHTVCQGLTSRCRLLGGLTGIYKVSELVLGLCGLSLHVLSDGSYAGLALSSRGENRWLSVSHDHR